MHAKDEYIAVFDSGLGGISVLKELRQLLPKENFLYFGDSANAPYGSRTTQQVQELTMTAAEQLLARGVKALVVACNTATAAAISTLRETYPDTIIVGIEPALKLAADHFPTGRVGVLATPLTLREEKFASLAQRFPQMQVTSIPLPGLVEKIETGASREEIADYLYPVLLPYRQQLDAAVLGCTHYPLVQTVISELLGPDTVLLDGGRGTAMQTLRLLDKAGLLRTGTGSVQIEASSLDKEYIARAMALLEENET